MELTPLETTIIDRLFLQGNPPQEAQRDIYQHVLGTVVTAHGWWLLADRRTSGPLWAHA
jgi:hypothetical protein